MVTETPEFIELSQREYVEHCVAKYEEAEHIEIRPRKAFPALPYDGPGQRVKNVIPASARSAIGGLMYAARGTRPDICRAVVALASRVHSWDDACSEFMRGVMGYLRYHDYAIRYMKHKGEVSWHDYEMVCHSDSNFLAPASTSGTCMFIQHKETKKQMILDWASKKQGSCALSSCEAELIALAASTKCALSWGPVLDLFKEHSPCGRKYEGPASVMVGCDNMAACLSVKRGYSKQLLYLSRTQGCCIQWLHEVSCQGMVHVMFVPGVRNFADPLTKLINDGGMLRSLLHRGVAKPGGLCAEGACDATNVKSNGSSGSAVGPCGKVGMTKVSPVVLYAVADVVGHVVGHEVHVEEVVRNYLIDIGVYNRVESNAQVSPKCQVADPLNVDPSTSCCARCYNSCCKDANACHSIQHHVEPDSIIPSDSIILSHGESANYNKASNECVYISGMCIGSDSSLGHKSTYKSLHEYSVYECLFNSSPRCKNEVFTCCIFSCNNSCNVVPVSGLHSCQSGGQQFRYKCCTSKYMKYKLCDFNIDYPFVVRTIGSSINRNGTEQGVGNSISDVDSNGTKIFSHGSPDLIVPGPSSSIIECRCCLCPT